ncbi:MAG: hypothetical protein ACXVCH_03350 [Bdellovibrionota bacterium]
MFEVNERARGARELFGDFCREASVLVWVFGGLLPHEEFSYWRGTVIAVGSVLLFFIGVWFEQLAKSTTKGS